MTSLFGLGVLIVLFWFFQKFFKLKEEVDGTKVVRKYVVDKKFSEKEHVPSGANNNTVLGYAHKGDIVDGAPVILWVVKKPHVMFRCVRIESSQSFKVNKSVSLCPTWRLMLCLRYFCLQFLCGDDLDLEVDFLRMKVQCWKLTPAAKVVAMSRET